MPSGLRKGLCSIKFKERQQTPKENLVGQDSNSPPPKLEEYKTDI